MTIAGQRLPSKSVPATDLHRAADLLLSAADAVGRVLAANTNWGPSGLRDSQYAVDLDADAACLDGSTNASRGVPWFASALCLVDADGPAVGVVVNHATGDRFLGIRGGAAENDGRPIRPSNVTRLGDAILGVSGLPARHYGWSQFRALGASAPDICAVASGVTDAWCDMHDAGHGVWDYLASVVVIEAAGGVAGEVFGRDLCVLDHTARRAPVVAATPELLAEVIAARTGA